MAAWSCPDTEVKAKKLARLMRKPLTRAQAEDKLFDLIGDDDLYDKFMDCDDEVDVRPLVWDCLGDWLGDLDQFHNPWEPKAIEICEKIVSD